MKTSENQTAPLSKGNISTKEEQLEKVTDAAKKLEKKMPSNLKTTYETAKALAVEGGDDHHAQHLTNDYHEALDENARACLLVFINGDKLRFNVRDGRVADKIQLARERAELNEEHFCLGAFCDDMSDIFLNDMPIHHYHYSNSIHPSKFTTLIV